MARIFIGFIVCLLFLSCSSDNNEFSDASIKGYSFKLTSLELSQAVDLNLDGIPSIDMIDEFECIGDELIIFNEFENQIIYQLSGVQGRSKVSTSDPQFTINYFECPNDEEYLPLSGFGNYKMINENVVEANITLRLPTGQKSHKTQYTIDSENNKITEITTESYPTIYILQTLRWELNTIQIKKVFTRL